MFTPRRWSSKSAIGRYGFPYSSSVVCVVVDELVTAESDDWPLAPETATYEVCVVVDVIVTSRVFRRIGSPVGVAPEITS